MVLLLSGEEDEAAGVRQKSERLANGENAVAHVPLLPPTSLLSEEGLEGLLRGPFSSRVL